MTCFSAESIFAVTDPELLAFYQDFAFGDPSPRRSGPPHRLIYQLAVTITVGAVTEFRTLLGAALVIGVTPVQIKELTEQAVAYVGIGRAIDFISTTNDVLVARGSTLALPSQATTTPETRMTVGIAKQ